MRVDRKIFETGVATERQKHHVTWEWIEWYLKKYKRLPKEEEFYLHIAHDNLKLDEHYYT